LLSEKEIKILSEIAEIKKKENPEWGMWNLIVLKKLV
jgi:hypothetical protein